jgi:two-component system sensor histidine kinase BarA
VTEADHGARAFEYYRQQHFDLIILDIQMPDIDGATLLQMMRDHNPGDDTPVVALTANILNDEAERLLELGFDYYLSKPIDEAQFRALLDGEPTRKLEPSAAADIDGADSDLSLDYPRSLALSAGNQSLLRQILQILQRDIPDHQQELKDALDTQDRDRLGAIAHKLHGVTCYASLPRLRRMVVALQKQLSREESLPPDAAISELVSELDQIRSEVERLLDESDDRKVAN